MLDNIFKCIYAKLYAYIYIHIKDTLVEFIFGFLCLPHLAICTHESHSKRFTVLFHSKYILFVLSRFQRDIAIINWRESYIRFIRFCLNTPKRRRTRRTKERWNEYKLVRTHVLLVSWRFSCIFFPFFSFTPPFRSLNHLSTERKHEFARVVDKVENHFVASATGWVKENDQNNNNENTRAKCDGISFHDIHKHSIHSVASFRILYLFEALSGIVIL